MPHDVDQHSFSRVAAPLFDGDGLVTRRVTVARADVAWVRYVLEGHEGLASLHIERGGVLTLVAPACRARELDEVLDDLAEEIELGAPPHRAEGATDGPRPSDEGYEVDEAGLLNECRSSSTPEPTPP